MEERWIAGTLPANACCYVAASADKIVSNQKPPSPKIIERPGPSPSTSITGQTGGSLCSAVPAKPGSADSSSNSMDISTRPTPGPSQTDAATPRSQSNPFSAAQPVQTHIQPLHGPLAYNTPSYIPPAQVHDESFIQPVNPYPYPRPIYPSSAPHTLRRAQTMPTVPQQPFSQWPQIPAIPVAEHMFSSYSPNAQTHPASHGYSAHPHHPASQPQTIQLPPPLPPIHHQQPHTSLGSQPQHDMTLAVADDRVQHYDATQRIAPHLGGHLPNVSFSEFLESPIPDRAYELGSVTEGGVSVEDVGIGVTRSEEPTGGPPIAK